MEYQYRGFTIKTKPVSFEAKRKGWAGHWWYIYTDKRFVYGVNDNHPILKGTERVKSPELIAQCIINRLLAGGSYAGIALGEKAIHLINTIAIFQEGSK